MNITRRHFAAVSAGGFAGGLMLLDGCTALQATAALKQAAADTTTIATALKNALPQLVATKGASSAVIASVSVAIADIQSVAAAVSIAATPAAALPNVQQLEADLNAVVSALAGLPLPAPISTALTAASVLLPVIELAVGMVVPPSASKMTPDQARAILKAV